MNDFSETAGTQGIGRMSTWFTWVAFLVAFLLPLFIIPTKYVSFQYSKNLIIFGGTALLLLFWLISKMRTGKVVFPRGILPIASIVFLLVMLVSTLLSPVPKISFIGLGFELGTFISVSVMVLLMWLSSAIFDTQAKVFKLYGVLSLDRKSVV